MVTTYLLASWHLRQWLAWTEIDEFAKYASLGVLLYGMGAVAVELLTTWGGKFMVYAYAEIKRFAREMREKENAKAVELVASNPALLRQANEAAREREKEAAK